METFSFTNESIACACEKVGQFLASVGVERREALRTKLTFEDILLDYQERMDEQATFSVRFIKRFSSIKIEILVAGPSYNPLDENGEENELIQGLLAGLGLAPTWNYKNGRNYILFIPKKRPMSSTVKTMLAIVLSIICGLILTLLPDALREGISNYVLSPVTDTVMGLISALAGPLIFLSVLGSICAMGNLDTLGKIGARILKTIFIFTFFISLFTSFIGSLFFPMDAGTVETSGFGQVLELIYDIVPDNLIQPFISGNALQLIFIAVMVGLAMLALSSRVNGVFKLVEQFSSIVQRIMSSLSSVLPYLIFILFTDMVSSGDLGIILGSWKMILTILMFLCLHFGMNLLRISITQKISPLLLFKKCWPTFIIALTTASSAAAFSTNIRDCTDKLGIDKKLTEFGVPIGQVLFMPAYIVNLFCLEIFFASSMSIPITVPWLILGMVANLLISYALPPVPGGAMMGLSIAFMQLGIPLEVMGIAMAVTTIVDFPVTACNVSTWQLNMISLADSLSLLDKETLHRKP